MTTNEPPRHIDIKLPRGWNQCSTAQLEQIMTLYLLRQARQDRYHPFDPLQWKTECFFALAGLEVVGVETKADVGGLKADTARTAPSVGSDAADTAGTVPSVGSDAAGEPTTGGPSPSVSVVSEASTTYTVRFRRPSLFQRIRLAAGRVLRPVNGGSSAVPPFPLADWQLLSFIDQHLKWLDHFDQLLIFPYKRLGHDWLSWHWHVAYPLRLPLPLPYPKPEAVCGPDTLMQDFSWQEYRFAQQYLESYTMQQNQTLRLARQAERARTADDRREAERLLADAQRSLSDRRTQFLMAIFRTRHATGRLRRMSDPQFQLILIYWQSVMHRLASKYPRCFRTAPVGQQPKKNQTPLDLYVRSIATLEKYLSQSEEEINRKMFYANLQHLEDMSREAEEMERISRQNKSRGKK